MRKLNLKTPIEIQTTSQLEFPTCGITVEVKRLSQIDWQNVQKNVVAGRDENDPQVNQEVEVYIASLGIIDESEAVFNSDEGRKELQKLPSGVIKKIAQAIMGLDGMDMRVAEKKS